MEFSDAWAAGLEGLGERDAAEWLKALEETRERWRDAYEGTGRGPMAGLVGLMLVLEEPWTKAQPYRLVA